MAEKQATTEFQFVNSTIDTPTVPQDLAIRALIRKQAMKKASAARKRDGNYGKHNLRQYPVFLFDQTNSVDIQTAEQAWAQGEPVKESNPSVRVVSVASPVKPRVTRPKIKRKEEERQQWIARHAHSESISPGLSAKGYEQTSMKTDFDILDLSTLATLHVGRMARRALSQNPYHLISQLRSFKQWSYLSFLPSMYGQISCLSDATDCVIARARQIISPNRNWEAAVITFYVKALDSLQKALDSPKERFKPEVLCATEILALYELLDPAGEMAWIRHAAGAARLIQLRGPKNYTTEFEKALFMAHTGPIMTEALLNGERCFLEQNAWKRVFRSVVVEDTLISDRSAIVIELMVLKSNIPGLFVDVTSIIYHTDPDPTNLHTIACKLQQLRTDLLAWHKDYEYLLSRAPAIFPNSAEFDRRAKVLATYLSCLIICNRLLGAISPTERVELEDETQVLAGQMLDLELEVKSTSSGACMFMAQTLGVSQFTIASSVDWLFGEDRARSSSFSISGSGSASGGFSEHLGVEKLESVSPEGFVSDVSSGLPSAGLSSAGHSDSSYSRGPGGLLERWKFDGWCAPWRKMPS